MRVQAGLPRTKALLVRVVPSPPRGVLRIGVTVDVGQLYQVITSVIDTVKGRLSYRLGGGRHGRRGEHRCRAGSG